MHRMEGSVVKRYAEVLDQFIKIRMFSSEEAHHLLRGAELTNKSTYQQLILHACVVAYTEDIQPRLRKMPIDLRDRVDGGLYELAIEVNPELDIRKVSIPIFEGPAAAPQIHLIEREAPRERERMPAWAKDLERILADRVIGQDAAATLLARGIKKAVAGIRDTRRPVGTFLFVGQTGVGKTEMAKALTDVMFQEASRLVRVDCSEYALPHEYAKLIGAPPGYIGYNEGGQLTEKIKSQGGCVVLFDEIEKADAKVHNLLLQLFDEGFITDGKGHRVNCAECVVILTSNAGVEDVTAFQNGLGFDAPRREQVVHEERERLTRHALARQFRPEFLNRIDEIVTFRTLTVEDAERIAGRMLEEVAGFAGANAGLRVDFPAAVRRHVARAGFSPEYGARELRRTVKRLVESPLSEDIIAGKWRSGDRLRARLGDGDPVEFIAA